MPHKKAVTLAFYTCMDLHHLCVCCKMLFIGGTIQLLMSMHWYLNGSYLK